MTVRTLICGVLLVSITALACSKSTKSEALSTTTRIEHVTASLRPPVQVVGRAPMRWSLAQRMAHYHVPGVSIALIDGGRISWARGFGVRQAGTAD